MNIITAQLTSLSPLLSKDPIPKREFVQKAHTFTKRRGVVNLLEMIEFNEAFLLGDEIVLK
ncbi:MAG TPA: hypothetical protein VN722_08405 [Hanamia sp.]|nr:hypothetical protein [Hanamia sp.]